MSGAEGLAFEGLATAKLLTRAADTIDAYSTACEMLGASPDEDVRADQAQFVGELRDRATTSAEVLSRAADALGEYVFYGLISDPDDLPRLVAALRDLAAGGAR